MQLCQVSEYNRDQGITFKAVNEALQRIGSTGVEKLKESVGPYLAFRRELEEFQAGFMEAFCRKSCFETGISGCCGFESIITFFADHAISFLLSEPREKELILGALEQPNRTKKCVYLARSGCIWKIRPIACAMFLCGKLKSGYIECDHKAKSVWTQFQDREKEFTWPTKPVLFDDLETYFMGLGVRSPHMHFHQSPGLIRLKARSGVAG